jgi:hypothetical protein
MEQAIEEVGEYRTATEDAEHQFDVFVKCDACEGLGYHVTYDGPERGEDVECDECNGYGKRVVELGGEEALFTAFETGTTTIEAELRAFGLGAEAADYEAATASDKPTVANRILYALDVADRIARRTRRAHPAIEPLTKLIASVANKTQMKGAA